MSDFEVVSGILYQNRDTWDHAVVVRFCYTTIYTEREEVDFLLFHFIHFK